MAVPWSREFYLTDVFQNCDFIAQPDFCVFKQWQTIDEDPSKCNAMAQDRRFWDASLSTTMKQMRASRFVSMMSSGYPYIRGSLRSPCLRSGGSPALAHLSRSRIWNKETGLRFDSLALASAGIQTYRTSPEDRKWCAHARKESWRAFYVYLAFNDSSEAGSLSTRLHWVGVFTLRPAWHKPAPSKESYCFGKRKHTRSFSDPDRIRFCYQWWSPSWHYLSRSCGLW
jgi:hypothetical protein